MQLWSSVPLALAFALTAAATDNDLGKTKRTYNELDFLKGAGLFSSQSSFASNWLVINNTAYSYSL